MGKSGRGLRMSKQFQRISKRFGFNRNRLSYWEFQIGEDEVTVEAVTLYFENTSPFVLIGDEVQTFRNWTENEAEEAPETYQYTMFGAQQDTQDLKQNSTQPRGK